MGVWGRRRAVRVEAALVGSWSLGGPIAEAVTSEAGPSEEALERRTRRTHWGRPCNNPAGAECYLYLSTVRPKVVLCRGQPTQDRSQEGVPASYRLVVGWRG